MKIWKPKPPGTLWATPDLLRDLFTLQYKSAMVTGNFTQARVYECLGFAE